MYTVVHLSEAGEQFAKLPDRAISRTPMPHSIAILPPPTSHHRIEVTTRRLGAWGWRGGERGGGGGGTSTCWSAEGALTAGVAGALDGVYSSVTCGLGDARLGDVS